MPARNILIIFALTFLYSVIRYNIIGNISYAEIPTLIVNKAIAFSLVFILWLALINYANKRTDDYRSYLSVFKIFALIHALFSIIIMARQGNAENVAAENENPLFVNISLLAGVLSFAYLLNNRYHISYIFFYFMIAAHIFFLGYKKWFDFEKWNGMPPITLISFLVMCVLIFYSVITKNFRDIKFNK